MLRITRLILVGVVLLLGWIYALSVPDLDDHVQLLILMAPLLAIVFFGFYLFLRLLLGVASFKTVPEESRLLREDIVRAKKDLSRRGVID